jgi:nucleoside-diphosphate-sugar epimerase
MMRILVIGGTRFIGPYVVDYLHKQGHEVCVFHRGTTEAVLLPEGVQQLPGNRNLLRENANVLHAYQPDVVLDMIPITERHGIDLMTVFKGVAKRVVSISSIDVYRAYDRLTGKEPGSLEPAPLTEDSPLRDKLYPYRGETPRDAEDPRHIMDDYDKILVERAVMSNPDLPGTVLRLPMVYGPRDYQHRLFSYLKRMDDERPAIILSENLANWQTARGYVENVAEAIAMAVVEDRAAGRIYNVAEPEPGTELEWVETIAQVTGWKGDILVLPADQLPAHLQEGGDFRQHLSADTSRIRQELGYRESIDQTKALRHTIAWERANPPDPVDLSQFDYEAEDAVLHAQ